MLNRSELAHSEKILFKCAFRAGIGCTTQEHLHILLPTASYTLRGSYTQYNNDNNTELLRLPNALHASSICSHLCDSHSRAVELVDALVIYHSLLSASA